MGHQLPTAMANAILWDVILASSVTIPAKNPSLGVMADTRPTPVVRFRGHYYLCFGNPWPTFRSVCRLAGRPDNPMGDLAITSDGIVAKWADGAARRGYRRPTIVGVQEDVQPVLSIPVAGAITAAGTVRAVLSGAGAGPNDEQLQRGI